MLKYIVIVAIIIIAIVLLLLLLLLLFYFIINFVDTVIVPLSASLSFLYNHLSLTSHRIVIISIIIISLICYK